MARILIIDDDETVCASLSHVVKRMGHEPSLACTLRAGLDMLARQMFDVVFLDVRMPDGNGLDIMPDIEQSPSSPEIIIMTGFGNANGAELAIKCGAWDYIPKGSSVKEITLSVVRALQYREQKQAGNQTLSVVNLKREGIVGNSPRLMACLDLVAKAAASDVSVLVTGETGTGKELIARAVHQNSSRAGGNFIVVDCAALPENLVESLLFGHEKGAFTGADQSREGLVRQANGGTLFLDEVGELPMSLQKAFLRVLQEHCFRPVGGLREVESNFRLVTATNKDLAKMAREGHFREDLLFRLQSFIIELPPLRERREDIKDLVRYHLDTFCERYNLAPKGVSPEFISTLSAYDWPGNVRELVNALERTVSSARFEHILFPKHLPVNIRVELAKATIGQEASSPPTSTVQAASQPSPLHDFRENILNQAEKQYFQDLMALVNDNIAEACRLAGISQSRLYALLKKHDIPH